MGLSPEALELRRIRRLIQNVIGVGLAVAIVAFVWYQTDQANTKAEENADRMVACILAGGTADEC